MSIRSHSVLMAIWLVSSATGQTAIPGTTTNTPLQSIFELEELFIEQQYSFLPIAPPSEETYLHSSSQIVPVVFDNFPKKFQNKIMAEYDESTGIPLYPITVEEDPVSRYTVFRNVFGVEIFQLAPEADYNPFAWQEWKFDLAVGETLDPFTQWLYDPAHIAVSFTLIDSIYYDSYLEEQEAQRLAAEAATLMQPMMMTMSVPLTKPIASMTTGSNGLVTLNISVPDTYGSYVEIFDRDWLQQWDDWELAKSWLPTYGNAQVNWEDSASSGKNHRFYYIGDATDDPEGDGYSTLRETLVTGTDPDVFNMIDEDNDGMHDWWETKIFGGTDQAGSGDFDGDGLLNNEEMVYVSSGSPSVTMTSDPSLFDTDADGMDDGFEESYYWLDPMDSSDAGSDRDGDNLTNLEEYQIGTLPDEEDTDGDGLDDWGEYTFGLDPTVPYPGDLTADSDGDLMPNEYEINNFLNPWDASDKYEDKDRDGLDNYWEYTNNLAAGNWDTDGDTLPDGTEVEWGTQPDVADDLNSDSDGDGLTLSEEYENVTNPNIGDSDSDGTNDGDEVDQGSDPADGSDGGTALPESDQVELTLTIGDDSGSHSEIYEMVVTGSPNKRLPSGGYGETATQTYTFKRGESYTITLIHRGTDPSWLEDHDEADYDYVAKVEEASEAQTSAMVFETEEEDWIPGDDGTPSTQMVVMAATTSTGSGVVIDDTSGILGTHRESTAFFASGKSAKAHVIKMEMITPAGDPVNAPVQSGDGQNEFTYSSAATGVLTLNLKAKVLPTGIADKVVDNCQFSVGSIGSSALTWDASNPSGKPTTNGDYLEATATYTGLPSNNSDFGNKKASIYFTSFKLGEEDFEVFFDGSDNSLGNPGSSAPNWFYYWKQTSASAGSPLYGLQWAGLKWEGNQWVFYIGPADNDQYRPPAGGDNAGVIIEGVDNFAWTVRHEHRHIQTSSTWYPNDYDGSLDPDGDWIPDSQEPSLGGTQMNPINGGPFSPGVYDTDSDGLRDDEDYTVATQQPWIVGSADVFDWSNSGSQY
ncbi:hypothetical protein P4E94_19005 [Pontiellaceae bacterium B12219]|nr:hypothetical protein [Pontiellaceae bacterium B12219]